MIATHRGILITGILLIVGLAGCAAVRTGLDQPVRVTVTTHAECHDVDRDEATVRRILGWSAKTLRTAQGLTRMSPEELCNLPATARDQLGPIIKEARKSDANGMIDYLTERHLDPNGEIPVDGHYRAVLQHNRLVELQREMSPKRAGIASGAWTQMGPRNDMSGRVRALHIDPRNSAIMLVGTASGGIWRTTDHGVTWQPVDSFSPAFSISGLAADPSNPSTIYASTSEFFQTAGLWRSADNGLTWQSVPALAPNQLVPGRAPGLETSVTLLTAVAVSPPNPQIVVVAGRGVLVTTNGGASWQQVATYTFGSSTYSQLPATYFVSFDPKDGRKVYLGSNRGTVIIGTDVGTPSESWQEQIVAIQTANTLVTTMAWSANGQSAWITTNEQSGTVYRSSDGGHTFSLASVPRYCGGQCGYNDVLWVDPTNPGRLVLGGVRLYRSVDAGATWGPIDQGANNSAIHVDHHAAIADPGFNGTTNKTVYFGNDGGVHRTTDISANVVFWENYGKGIDATQFYAIAANKAAGIILGGTQDNGTYRFQSGTSWTTVTGYDGGYPGIPNAGTPLYSAAQSLGILRTPYNPTYTYGDWICDGITDAIEWDRAVWNAATGKWDTVIACGVAGRAAKSIAIPPLLLDPNNDKRMYAGGESLWAANDVSSGTPVWRAIKPPAPVDLSWHRAPYISAIAIMPGDPNNVWVGHQNGDVYRTSNALAATPAWTQARLTTNSRQGVTSIFIAANNAQRVTITLSGYSSSQTNNVLRTWDGGGTWSNISNNLPNAPAYSVVENPTNANYLYVGMDTGVYATEDGSNWSSSNDAPALVPVYMLKWYDDKTLLAATYGRGVWKATVAGTFISQSDCLFSWAERIYPNLFPPANVLSGMVAPYYYRYYTQTNVYLGTSSANSHIYYFANNSLLDVGALASWLITAGCQ